MKLWIDGKEENAGSAVRAVIREQVVEVNWKVKARSVRAVNALRNAELRVLKGQRSGRVYRKPYTKHATYRASAPGEVPARRTGNLRLHWNGEVKSESNADGGVDVTISLESQERYAGFLEYGTPKMAPRPFVERIKQEAAPEIEKIYQGI